MSFEMPGAHEECDALTIEKFTFYDWEASEDNFFREFPIGMITNNYALSESIASPGYATIKRSSKSGAYRIVDFWKWRVSESRVTTYSHYGTLIHPCSTRHALHMIEVSSSLSPLSSSEEGDTAAGSGLV